MAKPKFDPNAANVLALPLTIEAAPSHQSTIDREGNTKKQQKQNQRKRKQGLVDSRVNYGSGVLELYSLGRIAYDWKYRYDRLDDYKKIGVQAHVAMLLIYPAARLEHKEELVAGAAGPYIADVNARLEVWRQQWGDIPGWWNWWNPRP